MTAPLTPATTISELTPITTPEFTPATKQPLKVYFMHGLESGPHGRKTRYLRSRFEEVHCGDMNLSVFNMKRQHNLVRLMFWKAVTLQWRNMVGSSLQEMFQTSVAIQIDAFKACKPDVLIGSSWGGAVAMLFIAKGQWSGPVVLLAPALRFLVEWGVEVDLNEICTAVANSGCRITIYHGTNDDVVPFAHSQELRDRCPNVTLFPVEGGDHRLDTPLITEDILKDAILSVHA
eukprot:c10230_g1_i1.p1 GENE.c10230_g1_i1~~c10230_g1_i1.p1  ORF type:complete len:269 (-),score=55.98 c10230_g1_i1:246-944(-)